MPGARRLARRFAATGFPAVLALGTAGLIFRQPVVRYPETGSGLFRYAISRWDSVTASMPGGESQTQVIARTAWLTITWAATDSGARIGVAVDSVVPEDAAARFTPSLDSTIGARWTAWREPDGRLVRVEGGPSSSIADEVRETLRFLFPLLPPGGAAPGFAWRDSAEAPALVSAFEATERARTTSVATLRPDQAVDIAVRREWTANGEGRQYRQPVAVSAAGTDSLLYRITENGEVLEVAGRRVARLELDLPAVGQRVSAEVRSAIAMRLLP